MIQKKSEYTFPLKFYTKISYKFFLKKKKKNWEQK